MISIYTLFTKTTFVLMLTLLVRILCVLLIGKIPCMETDYFSEGRNIIEGIPSVIYLSPLYSIVVYALSTVFDSIFYASACIFVLSSTAASFYMYSICKLWFNERTAYTSLLFLLFLPNLTVSVAGYSHSVMLGIALELAALFYMSCYFNSNSAKCFLLTCVFTIPAVCIRPELLLVLLPFYVVLLGHSLIGSGIKQSYTKIVLSAFFFLFLVVSVLMHKAVVHTLSSKKETAGIFTDNTYSYFTFIHTYSLRYSGVIDDQKAILASEPLIGSPQQNNYSIPAVIIKNPVQFISNALFNGKELLDNLAHPLFMPFYMYFFIGILLMSSMKGSYGPFCFISILFVLHVIPLLIFHVEIRYMQALSLLIIIVAAAGESKLESSLYRKAVVFCTSIIFIMYLINNMNMSSLCV